MPFAAPKIEKRTCSSEGEVNSTLVIVERSRTTVEGNRTGQAMVVVVVVVVVILGLRNN